MDYLDFELHIRPGEAAQQYVVAVAKSPIIGHPEVVATFPYTPDDLQKQIGGVRSALRGTHRGVVVQGGTEEASDEDVVKVFGRHLFEFLIGPDEIRLFYENSFQKARDEGKGLRLRLRIDTPELATLPWEFLYNPDDTVADFVCLSNATPLVRHFQLGSEVKPYAIEPPLRILAMCADPSDRARLDNAGEKERMTKALRPLTEAGLVQLKWLKGKTVEDLQVAMGRGPWHVFHFIGHGGFDEAAGEGLLVLEDEHGTSSPLSAENLVRFMRDEPALRLVVLNACSGAEGSETNIFSSTASALSRRNVPAVVAMQFEVTDKAAVRFTHAFYRFLAEGKPVDAALAEARKQMVSIPGGTLEWATPVLYLQSPDGKLFDVDQDLLDPILEKTKSFEPYVPSEPAPAGSGDGAPPPEVPAEPAPAEPASPEPLRSAPPEAATASTPMPASTAERPASGKQESAHTWKPLIKWGGIGGGVLVLLVLLFNWLNSVPEAHALEFEERNTRIEMGASEARINLILRDEDGFVLPVYDEGDYPVTWTSSNDEVATVEGRYLEAEERLAGFVSTVGPGTVTIRAALDETVAAEQTFTVLIPRDTLREVATQYQAVENAFSDPSRSNASVLEAHRAFLTRFHYALEEAEIDAEVLNARVQELESLAGTYETLTAAGAPAAYTLDERQERWEAFLADAQALRESPATATARERLAAIEEARSDQATIAFLVMCRISTRDCTASNITNTFAAGADVYFNVGIASPGNRTVRYEVVDAQNEVVDAGRSFQVSRSPRYRINQSVQVPDGEEGTYTLKFFNSQDDLIGRHQFTVGEGA